MSEQIKEGMKVQYKFRGRWCGVVSQVRPGRVLGRIVCNRNGERVTGGQTTFDEPPTALSPIASYPQHPKPINEHYGYVISSCPELG